MLNPKIKIRNSPQNHFKCRSDTVSVIKGDDQSPVSLEVDNLGARLCKVIVKLLLKEPEYVRHFYHLCRVSGKDYLKEIELDIKCDDTVVTFDFFGVKKALKKDALVVLKETFNKDAEKIYKKNVSTIVLHISLIDRETNEMYDYKSFQLSAKNDNICVQHYSPHSICCDDDSCPIITVISENPEKDTECISLELEHSNVTIPVKDFTHPLSNKNVFLFQLKPLEKDIQTFKARLCRTISQKVYSNWMDFKIVGSGIEHGKRKSNNVEECAPQIKVPRAILSPISEHTLSDVNVNDYFINQVSSISDMRGSSKSGLKSILETRVLSSIARVGHDFAFGKEVTDAMKNIINKLPLVFSLQDDVGDTPLHNAILKNQETRAIKIMDIVSQHCPDYLYTKNTSNHTALILSPACGVSASFVQRLLSYGFNILDKDIDGNSALTIAIQYKNLEVLQTLVQHAATQHSFENDHYEVLALLKRTILERYFEGFQILMQSQLANDYNLNGLDPIYLDLDADSTKVFEIFSTEFFNYETLDTMIPEDLSIGELEDYVNNGLMEDLELFSEE